VTGKDAERPDRENAKPPGLFSSVLLGIVRVVVLLTAVAVLFSLLGFLARWWWPLELMCHFRMQYAWFLGLAALLLWLTKVNRWALIALLMAVLNGALLLPHYLPAGDVPADRREVLRILSANVHTTNRRWDLFLDLVENQSPDIIVVMEVDERWIRELAPLRNDYRFVRLEPRPGNFGMAIYSRTPLRDLRVMPLGGVDTPAISATVKTRNGDLSLIAVHPLPPATPDNARLRNRQLAEAGRIVRRQTLPCVVIGDLNTTPWSPYFRDLLRQGLRDAHRGRGLHPTWPLQYPTPLLRIPIDHALVSDGVDVHRFQTAADINSDHLPIVVDVSLAEVPD